jgi:hypothetical protein
MRRAGLAQVLAACAAAVAAAAAVPSGAGAQASPPGAQFRNVVTFDVTGAPEKYTVPAQVVCATLDVYGAAGGDALGGKGGAGGRTTVTVALRAGEDLTVLVGGKGDDGTPGYNGGGRPTGQGFRGPQGGGGASEIRRGGATEADRFVVAGGGGGAAGDGVPPYGKPGYGAGPGGGPSGGGGDAYPGAGAGGGGATQTAPGKGGGGSAKPGQGPTGGDGGGLGGGGGGGYFGGGGGNGDAGGGGGAGFGPAGATLQTGVRGGNGLATITFNDNDKSCLKGAPAPSGGAVAEVGAPDPAVTPGTVDAAVSPADVKRESCDGSPVHDRPAGEADANDAFRAYGVPERGEQPYTLDHLVPAALGGTNAPANLWPEADAQAKQKDKAEARALAAVCGGKATLAEAQQQLETDWRRPAG